MFMYTYTRMCVHSPRGMNTGHGEGRAICAGGCGGRAETAFSTDDNTSFREVFGSHFDVGCDTGLHFCVDVGDRHLELFESTVGLDVLALVHLDVALGKCHHLGKYRGNPEIVDFVPLSRGLMENLHLVRSLLGLSVVANVRHQVVLRLRVGWLAIGVDVVSEVETLQWERHNGWILLNEEVVISEPLHYENHVGRNSSQAVSSDFSCLSALRDGLEGLFAVELLEEVKEWDLRNEIEVVLEERLIRKVEGHEHCLLLTLDDACLIIGR
mmetsp:Transcript_27710/g.41933  ORF Transcript_27710/g.41933 Transcript_27710/m.41933 type:complete len:269 (+) Transcript_27710:13-819(+)